MSVRSMTGFAQVRKNLHQGEILLSVKAVNHRGLDVHVGRMPKALLGHLGPRKLAQLARLLDHVVSGLGTFP